MKGENMSWIDMHAHLDKLEGGAELALQTALSEGVERIVTIGTDPADLPVVLKLSEQFAPNVFCTLGIHPHEGSSFDESVEKFILENAAHPRVIAIGEIGLDYYYQHASREDQIKAFDRQLQLAVQLGLPVEIHTRDAEQDTVEILKKYQGQVKGLIHCFTGTQWLADQCLALGFNISISGVVTFKNATALREVVKTIPLDRIHVETDSPFLAPMPMRGKQNTPAFVLHTAKVVADLKGISMDELQQATWSNARALFAKFN